MTKKYIFSWHFVASVICFQLDSVAADIYCLAFPFSSSFSTLCPIVNTMHTDKYNAKSIEIRSSVPLKHNCILHMNAHWVFSAGQ